MYSHVLLAVCVLDLMNVYSVNNLSYVFILTPSPTLLCRRLLCDVVKIKVDSEERVSRITRGNGEDIIMVSFTSFFLFISVRFHLLLFDCISNFLRRG